MKVMRKQTQTRPSRRRGSLFHYYMTYMFLTGVMLTTTGLCIHSLLKADRLDAQTSAYLKSLQRLDSAFRTDALDAEQLFLMGTDLTFRTASSESVYWQIEDNRITRQTGAEEQLQSSERFTFAKGTVLAFEKGDDTVTLSLTEPSPVPTADDKGAAERRSGRVSITVLRPKTQTEAAASTDDASDKDSDGDSDDSAEGDGQ